MSSFEKAGVLFITGLVAVILALALFGTSGTSSTNEQKPGDAGKDATTSTSPTDVGHTPDANGSGAPGVGDRPTLRPEDELWPAAEQKTREKRGSGASQVAGGTQLRESGNGTLHSPSGSSVRQHTVASGDRLASIAKQYLGDANLWKAIADANPGLDPARLKPGMKISIPEAPVVVLDSGSSPPTAPSASDTAVASAKKATDSRSASKPARKGTYIVKKGDTLSSIAAKELRSRDAWRKLYTINKHVVKDANRLPVGLTLDLPVEN